MLGPDSRRIHRRNLAIVSASFNSILERSTGDPLLSRADGGFDLATDARIFMAQRYLPRNRRGGVGDAFLGDAGKHVERGAGCHFYRDRFAGTANGAAKEFYDRERNRHAVDCVDNTAGSVTS